MPGEDSLEVVMSRFTRFAWGILGYTLLVILWGALVRATGSGAGCGSHWPLCNGEVIPRAPEVETLIELTHRITSGIALIGVVVMYVWARRAFSAGHIVRRGAGASVVFMIIEALLGAALVLFELVAHNASLTRAVSMALHLANTFLLVGAMSLTAWWSGGAPAPQPNPDRRRIGQLLIAAVALLFVGMSGAITALGDTLFPVEELRQGLHQNLSPFAQTLIQLRVLHPLIAVLAGCYTVVLAWSIHSAAPTGDTRRLALGLSVLYVVQLVIGGANVWLAAPVWMQLVHLLLADLVWILLVLLGAAVLAQPSASGARAPATAPDAAWSRH
jgi:heme A synthase